MKVGDIHTFNPRPGEEIHLRRVESPGPEACFEVTAKVDIWQFFGKLSVGDPRDPERYMWNYVPIQGIDLSVFPEVLQVVLDCLDGKEEDIWG